SGEDGICTCRKVMMNEGELNMNFTVTLGIKYPIIQAPMAGVTTPRFVAAAAEVGILGSIGAGYLSGEATRVFIEEVRKLTDKPIAVNLFVPNDVEMDQELMRQAYLGLQSVGKKLGMPFWRTPLSEPDRKSTRLNSSHVKISYAVFCLKKKNNIPKSMQYDPQF